MEFHELPLKGAYVIDLNRHVDDRGFFARAFCRREFAERDLAVDMVQTNVSFSRTGGTLRGMHYQSRPRAEAKLVRCTRGALFDAIVDVRPESTTFGEWTGIELTEANRRMIYVPEGFAHGFITLVDDTEVVYQVSEYYAPGYERGIRFDDPAVGIEWPREVAVVSEKDRQWPNFALETAGAS